MHRGGKRLPLCVPCSTLMIIVFCTMHYRHIPICVLAAWHGATCCSHQGIKISQYYEYTRGLIREQSRTFTAALPRALPPAASTEIVKVKESNQGRSKKATGTNQSKKRKPKPRPKGKGKARAVAEEDEAISISSGDDAPTDDPLRESVATRRSKRSRKVVAGGYREDQDDEMPDADAVGSSMVHDIPGDDYQPMETEPVRDGSDTPVVPKREEEEPSLGEPPAANMEDTGDGRTDPDIMDVELVDEEEEESKPKPILKLRYHGFNIHGRCLCVIVEPYPPIRSGTRAPSLAPTGLIAPRAPSIAPPDFVPSGGAGQRERTPLFLPEFDREPTPAPSGARTLPPVPLFSGSTEDSDEEDGGMILFSQILRSVGDHTPGIAEDDDEIEGAVFFGDADETREL